MTIPRKICLFLGQHIVDDISNKSLHKYHRWHISEFGSVGNIYFLSYLWNTWDRGFVVFHGNHKVHSACKAFTPHTFHLFCCLAKARCSQLLASVQLARLLWATTAFTIKAFSLSDKVRRWVKDVARHENNNHTPENVTRKMNHTFGQWDDVKCALSEIILV